MKKYIPKLIILFELSLAAIFIVSDYLIPTLFVLVLMIISFKLRKQRFSILGFKKFSNWKKDTLIILGLSVLWTIFVIGITAPIMKHVFGFEQDTSAFNDLKGNLPQLFGFLFLSWTLAAFGEEIVYRGYLQIRAADLVNNPRYKFIFAMFVSSILFGLAHTEQAFAGFVFTFFDGIFFSLLKRRFNNNLWASVLAHGFNNTIGIIAFFIMGPIHSLW